MSDILYPNHEIILDTEYAILIHYPDQKMIHHKIRKPVAGEMLRMVLDTGAGVLEKNKAIKWLSDDRDNARLPPEDMDWASTNWRPRVFKAGWKYWALVVPEAMLARFVMMRAVDSAYEGGLRIMAFTKLEEAKKWLEEL